MITYLIVSIVSGILFGTLDGILHGNSLAQRLFEVYKPIARTSVNMLAGILIDLAYGFILAGTFLMLYAGLCGDSGIIKGLCFAALVWFFRSVMQAASQWMMFKVPGKTLLYTLAVGLLEMLILGILYGLTLTPGV